jgi:hypothetical protein
MTTRQRKDVGGTSKHVYVPPSPPGSEHIFMGPTDLPTGDPNDRAGLVGVNQGDHLLTDRAVWFWNLNAATGAVNTWIKEYDLVDAASGPDIEVYSPRTAYPDGSLVLVPDPKGADWEWHLFRANGDHAAGDPGPLDQAALGTWEMVGEHILYFATDTDFTTARNDPAWVVPPKGTLAITAEGVWEAETGTGPPIAGTTVRFYSDIEGTAPPFTRAQVTRSPDTRIPSTAPEAQVIAVYTDIDPGNPLGHRLDVYVSHNGTWWSLTGDFVNDYTPAANPSRGMTDWFQHGSNADYLKAFGPGTRDDVGVMIQADRSLIFTIRPVIGAAARNGFPGWQTQPVPADIDVHGSSAGARIETWRKVVPHHRPRTR